MSEAIMVALITGGISLIGVFISGMNTRNKMTADIDKKIAVIDVQMKEMSRRIDDHNGYAKMFSENIPAIRQHLEDTDRRLESIERRLELR